MGLIVRRRRIPCVRFFTMAWWCGTQTGDAEARSAGYAAHLDTVRDRLPPDLLATQESVSLHDTRLRELRLAEGTLTLGLDSHAGDERLTLTYTSVERFESVADPEVGLGGPAGYGDLGYCEVDALPGGAFEHRLLFSTGIELVVVFHGFRLQRARCAGPVAVAEGGGMEPFQNSSSLGPRRGDEPGRSAAEGADGGSP
jgi:hypothetical protein